LRSPAGNVGVSPSSGFEILDNMPRMA